MVGACSRIRVLRCGAADGLCAAVTVCDCMALARPQTRVGSTLTARNLRFKAGKEAFDSVRREGFAPDRIGTIAGASGGAKWLVLSQLDRVIFDRILPRLRAPVHLLGSSIGAWRFACYAQADPLAANSVAYDMVLNGVELGGGSLRIHDAAMQQAVLAVLGISEQEAQSRVTEMCEKLLANTVIKSYRFTLEPAE